MTDPADPTRPGDGHRRSERENPFLQTGDPDGTGHSVRSRGAGPSDPEPATPASIALSIGLGLALNLITLVGVLAWGWPAGNVFALFWLENLVLGGWTVVKVRTAKGAGGRTPMTINGRRTEVGPRGAAWFFCAHYGLFCLIQGVFTALVAWRVGFEPDFWVLVLPLLLIIVRYSVETMVTWFGAGDRRDQVSPGQAMMEPYPRIVVLQLAVIAAFGLFVVGSASATEFLAAVRSTLAPVLGTLGADLLSDQVVAVLLLIIAKLVVDVATTAATLRR